MVGMASRRMRRAWAGGLIGSLAALAFAQSARAGDGDFFSSIFGGGFSQPSPAQPMAEPDAGGDQPAVRHRSLTVRIHRPKVVHYAKPDGKPVKVSIFEDRTLRRGDAVMTASGIRIFAGSSSWPYQRSDFVAIADAGHMNGTYQKALLALDKLPPR